MIQGLQEGQRVVCIGLQALLTRNVFGNNEEGCKNAYNELNKYLTGSKAGGG
jgi:hypothetical protein